MEIDERNTGDPVSAETGLRLPVRLSVPVVLIVAPAGAGKTRWLRQTAAAWHWQVAWVALQTADDEPAVFAAHLDTALRAAGLVSARLPPRPGHDPRLVVAAWINALLEWRGDCILVFDNYHVIETVAIHAAVSLLLDNVPPPLHVWLASRIEPPLQFPRLRVRRQMLELGPGDLAGKRTE